MSYSTKLSCPICRVKGGLHKMYCQNASYVHQAVESAEEEALTAIANQRVLERQLQEAQRWKRAVDNELVCCHLGTTDSMEPSVAIASIGRWHYDLGVSGVCEPDSTAGEPE